jgi:hypothetical protein
MLLNIVKFIDLLLYSIVLSQPFFYALAMTKSQKGLSAPAYIELRNLIDKSLQVKMRLLYYSVLVVALVLIGLSSANPTSLLFICSVVSFAGLAFDMYFTLKGNIPVNKIIQGWSPDNYPPEWAETRKQWFFYYSRRQIADIVGFVSLLVGVVFG